MGAVAKVVVRRPRLIVGAWILAVVAAVPLAASLDDRISNGGYAVPGAESTIAEQVAVDGRTAETTETVYVYLPPPHGSVADDVAASLRRYDRVLAVKRPIVTQPSGVVLLPVELMADFGDAQEIVGELRSLARDAAPRNADVEIIGRAASLEQVASTSRKDLSRAELGALPLTLIVLIIAFVSAVAAAVPVVVALVSLAVIYAVLALIASVSDTSVFVTNTATALALGLSIDYSLFIVSRYRELVGTGGITRADAIAGTLQTTGRAVLFSALTVAASLASLLLLGVQIFSSMAVGATVAALVAAGVSLTLVPAVLKLLDSRIDSLAARPVARAAARATLWRWIGSHILRHRVAAAAASLLILLTLSVPLLSLKIGFPPTAFLPDDDPVERATLRVEHDLGKGALAPIEIFTKGNPDVAADYIAADRGVSPLLKEKPAANGWTRIRAFSSYEPNTPAAEKTIKRLRAALARWIAAPTVVGGQTAHTLDITDRIRERFPFVVAAAALLTILLLLWAFRSVIVPIKALVTNALSVSAALGILVATFQWLGDEPSLVYFVPVFLFAIMFGLSMDYEVLLVSRIREEFLRGAANDDAIMRGLATSGRPITLAALVMVIVFLALAASDLAVFQQLGFGLMVAVILDATLVRCVLVPSVLALLGRANWWPGANQPPTKSPARASRPPRQSSSDIRSL